MPNFIKYDRKALPDRAKAFITIQTRGYISYNRATHTMAGNPTHVELLYDPDEQIIGLREVDPSKSHAYRVRRQGRSNSYIISAQGFLNYFDIMPKTSRRYVPKIIGDVLTIDLKEEGIDASDKESRKGRRKSPGAA